MLLVLAVCAAPVIASYLTYYVFRPEGRRNYGELIQPQRAMPELAAQGLDGASLSLGALKGQWLLVSVAGGACDADCERHLYLQRQLRESMGRDKDRMDWVWLVDDALPVRAELRAALSAATVVRLPRADIERWLAPAAGQKLSAHLYVVDPLGNWMMRFPAQIDPNKARRDLGQLLRASAGWDQPGR